MKRCSNCLMADTKPGIILDENGICQACLRHKARNNIDWTSRERQLDKICTKYRTKTSFYDCIIPVSGGKDSYFQTWYMKRKINMHPLLVSVADPFTKTKAGMWNLRNLKDVFDCDLVTFELSPFLCRKLVRAATIELGSPTWPIDRAIYVFPIRYAIQAGIPLVVYGENVSWEYGGVLQEETYSAKDQIKNDVAKIVDPAIWEKHGINSAEDLNSLIYPSEKEILGAKLEPVYLSYFTQWDGWQNYQIAKRYGFRNLEHEWDRIGYPDDYDQIDSIGYLINPWFKWPKYGFARATDVVGYWIRSGLISKEDGVRIIEGHDGHLDRKILDDFLNFTGFSHAEFWDIVDKWTMKEKRLIYN